MKYLFILFLSLFFFPAKGFSYYNDDINQVLYSASSSFNKVSFNMLKAIAKVESNFNPWAINIAGKPYHFTSKETALNFVKPAFNDGKSIDFGLMQINSWWLKKYDISVEAVLDPVANAYLGSWILNNEINNHNTLDDAIGAYHSPNKHKANKYLSIVKKALNNIEDNEDKKFFSKDFDYDLNSSPILVKSKNSVFVSSESMLIDQNISSMKVPIRKKEVSK
ncbi:MAG: lytic transglycosylase domain-containing protein [Rickettsiales bacterium]|jgi:hypothetical protein|nr:lytic transglycosylase domain-containing protein [Rickettsiales bacterium]